MRIAANLFLREGLTRSQGRHKVPSIHLFKTNNTINIYYFKSVGSKRFLIYKNTPHQALQRNFHVYIGQVAMFVWLKNCNL